MVNPRYYSRGGYYNNNNSNHFFTTTGRKTWVRTRDDDMTTTENYHSHDDDSASHVTNNSNTTRPVLRGRPKQNRVWKRNNANFAATAIVTSRDEVSSITSSSSQLINSPMRSVPSSQQPEELSKQDSAKSISTLMTTAVTTISSSPMRSNNDGGNLERNAKEKLLLKKQGRHKLVIQHNDDDHPPSSLGKNKTQVLQHHDDSSMNSSSASIAEMSAKQKLLMKKRGRHKLVLKSSNDVLEETKLRQEGEREKVKHQHTTTATSPTTNCGNDINDPDALENSTKQRILMKKIGRNQLVVRSDVDIVNVPHIGGGSSLEEINHSTSIPDGMEKRGHHKLVLKSTQEDDEDVVTRRSTAKRNHLARKARQQRGYSGPHQDGCKRIRLDIPVTSKDGDADQEESMTSSQAPKPNDDDDHGTQTIPKLTEFAYRETSKIKGKRQSHPNAPAAPETGTKWIRGRGTCSTGVQNKNRNMGLVRVVPDPTTTPVCSTFLRGIECIDETCSKRHDIPKEAATPICAFFQRKGQCLKGDACPFRHVKMNSHAEICPNFSILGFCQDKDCKMKHIFHRSTTRNANASDSMMMNTNNKSYTWKAKQG
mmetsp:Transcript_26697/g.37628  ORF Transcript_26697/g.37628 Transcript_26697/m.37628 type:complete len:596 (+) Transcript_26697:472-2259(+)